MSNAEKNIDSPNGEINFKFFSFSLLFQTWMQNTPWRWSSLCRVGKATYGFCSQLKLNYDVSMWTNRKLTKHREPFEASNTKCKCFSFFVIPCCKKRSDLTCLYCFHICCTYSMDTGAWLAPSLIYLWLACKIKTDFFKKTLNTGQRNLRFDTITNSEKPRYAKQLVFGSLMIPPKQEFTWLAFSN